MEHVLVRYAEIGTKSRFVRNQMTQVFRQRIEDRFEYGDLPYDKVSNIPGRVIAKTSQPVEAARNIAELPGVASASPAIRTEASIDSMKEMSEKFAYGESFGIDASRSGQHDFTSRDVQEEVGAHVEEFSGSGVDLDNPDTLLEIDIRGEEAFLFDTRIEGPGGYPVGTQGSLLALISGGIDSPVAAFQAMKRGADITPLYFYNRPVAAEDHLLRFKSAVSKLKRFNPSKKWEGWKVDMEPVNNELVGVERGRMVLHRIVMFQVAEKIAEAEGLKGLVTGESLGQKSSQTSTNLSRTSSAIDLPVHRPLLAWNKNQIIDAAKELGTMEDANVASACSTISPGNPSTELKKHQLEELKETVDVERLVKEAFEEKEKIAF